ncbi:Hypothetical protein CINCED_3A018638 [Cinara cedri]|uniref:Uncharacterized protein n=1 Tax=Cinara cedri TaxID=506608 RepID=A0A5E4NL00_9HEMI|nr:Hypothetical protein CINCED_3A018638 [Cinara cedri]
MRRWTADLFAAAWFVAVCAAAAAVDEDYEYTPGNEFFPELANPSQPDSDADENHERRCADIKDAGERAARRVDVASERSGGTRADDTPITVAAPGTAKSAGPVAVVQAVSDPSAQRPTATTVGIFHFKWRDVIKRTTRTRPPPNIAIRNTTAAAKRSRSYEVYR